MKLTIKNRFFTRRMYNDENQLLFIVKKRLLNPKETIISADGEKIFETNINNLTAPDSYSNGDLFWQYIICKADSPATGFATASLEYELTNQKQLGRFPFKEPTINKFKLTFADNRQPIIVTMQKYDTFIISDNNNNPLGEINTIGPCRGVYVDYQSCLSPALICALFILTRYLINENDLVIV